MSLVDRYIACAKQVLINEFQLVGITAMLIACKVHEIHKPAIADFLSLTKGSFFRAQMLEMENKLLKTINFAV